MWLLRGVRLVGWLRTTETPLFKNADLFLDVGVLELLSSRRGRSGGDRRWRWWWWRSTVVDSGREGVVDFFVTFPSV